jgi:TonB-dependent SusC/RagA subfamily outer membrane receptor
MKNLILSACAILLSISLIHAQESKDVEGENSKKENLHIKLKDDAKPDIYVDGKKFDFPMDLLDTNKIESVNVLKGDRAIEEYGAKNGVVLIVTKKEFPEKMSQVKVRGYGTAKGKTPMIIIDGKKSNQEILKAISPDDIYSIEVLKDAKSTAVYGAKGVNGVIIVITKKGKKK